MPTPAPTRPDRSVAFIAASALQFACGCIFLLDVVNEWDESLSHVIPEAAAVIALWIGAAMTLSGWRRTLQRNQVVEDQLRIATGAFQSVLTQHFDGWGLTPSERDVALLAIKGLSISEIAALRSTAEGTVKAQNAAVYRKAGVSGRAELLSVFIEEIVSGLPGR